MRVPGLSLAGGLSERLKSWVMGSRESDTNSIVLYDRTLLWLTFGLAMIGFRSIGVCIVNNSTESDIHHYEKKSRMSAYMTFDAFS